MSSLMKGSSSDGSSGSNGGSVSGGRGRGGRDSTGNGTNSEHGSSSNSSSNGEERMGLGGGNNSDNSALVSLGNTSFGFNFDSEEGSGNNTTSPRNGRSGGSSGNSDEGDSSSSNNDNNSDQGDGSNDGKDGKEESPAGEDSKGEAPELSSVKRAKTAEVTSSSSEGTSNPPSSAASVSDKTSSGQSVSTSKTATTSGSSPTKEEEVPAEATSSPSQPGTGGVNSGNRNTNNSDSSNTTVDPASSSNSSNGDGEGDGDGDGEGDGEQQSGSDSNFSPTAADAAEATAHLKAIAAASIKSAELAAGQQTLKRKSPEPSEDNSGGYNSDEDDEARSRSEISAVDSQQAARAGVRGIPKPSSNNTSGGGPQSAKKKKKLDEMKREERNAREKERSFRISAQISELRNLLSSGGVIVPKGTKSSVLTEAANYIRMLQQHQYRSEIDRHQLVQQIQMIGGGALGQQAATAVRHVSAQNGVWSLGNFGGVPPKSAMLYHAPGADVSEADETASQTDGNILPSKIVEGDYRHVFNSCGVGMAIASMGGAFIDCNRLFCQLSNHSKQDICAMTVFNLTSRQDLQAAFDLISQMLSAPTEPETVSSSSCVLRGSFKHRNDLGLSVTLIKGEDGVAKCFCVTVIMNPSSPFDPNPPIPATIDLISNASTAGQFSSNKDRTQAAIDATSQPAYTTG
eukprot:CAMPEP_0113500440 /NCGR_PEP_ID=MMETSP0014_2-20120614/32331_1 /TAXON_ID=2857 /ORGANISM="Nitzschia sp." /LENGTH=684 /DNA_ID=CAMNT_0000394779 /DNA_START=361 /DNA_END=2415 /DNA_ORIENTATION=- /assembly_acc=CAM_ASM_000159